MYDVAVRSAEWCICGVRFISLLTARVATNNQQKHPLKSKMGSSDKEVADTVVDGEAEPVRKSVIGSLSFIDRFLSVWILSVMVIGVVVGFYSPETQRGLSQIEGTSFAPMLKSEQLFH